MQPQRPNDKCGWLAGNNLGNLRLDEHSSSSVQMTSSVISGKTLPFTQLPSPPYLESLDISGKHVFNRPQQYQFYRRYFRGANIVYLWEVGCEPRRRCFPLSRTGGCLFATHLDGEGQFLTPTQNVNADTGKYIPKILWVNIWAEKWIKCFSLPTRLSGILSCYPEPWVTRQQ